MIYELRLLRQSSNIPGRFFLEAHLLCSISFKIPSMLMQCLTFDCEGRDLIGIAKTGRTLNNCPSSCKEYVHDFLQSTSLHLIDSWIQLHCTCSCCSSLGSGKTLAFLMPIFAQLLESRADLRGACLKVFSCHAESSVTQVIWGTVNKSLCMLISTYLHILCIMGHSQTRQKAHRLLWSWLLLAALPKRSCWV